MAAVTTPAVTTPPVGEYPPRADLRKMMADEPLPAVAPGTIDEASMTGEQPTQEARVVLDRFNAALLSNDGRALAACFFPSQAYWKDNLALTCHLRTLTTPGVIAAGLLVTKELRGIARDLSVEGTAQFHTGMVREAWLISVIKLTKCSHLSAATLFFELSRRRLPALEKFFSYPPRMTTR